MIRNTLAILMATALAGCAGSMSLGERDSEDARLKSAIGASASSDILLLAASSRAIASGAHRTELASADPQGKAEPTRRARSDGEESGAAIGSHAWKMYRGTGKGAGIVCSVHNYYQAPKGTR